MSGSGCQHQLLRNSRFALMQGCADSCIFKTTAALHLCLISVVCSTSSRTFCVHRFLLISADVLIVNIPFELPLSLFDGRSLVLKGDEDKVMAGDQQKGACLILPILLRAPPPPFPPSHQVRAPQTSHTFLCRNERFCTATNAACHTPALL